MKYGTITVPNMNNVNFFILKQFSNSGEHDGGNEDNEETGGT